MLFIMSRLRVQCSLFTNDKCQMDRVLDGSTLCCVQCLVAFSVACADFLGEARITEIFFFALSLQPPPPPARTGTIPPFFFFWFVAKFFQKLPWDGFF